MLVLCDFCRHLAYRDISTPVPTRGEDEILQYYSITIFLVGVKSSLTIPAWQGEISIEDAPPLLNHLCGRILGTLWKQQTATEWQTRRKQYESNISKCTFVLHFVTCSRIKDYFWCWSGKIICSYFDNWFIISVIFHARNFLRLKWVRLNSPWTLRRYDGHFSLFYYGLHTQTIDKLFEKIIGRLSYENDYYASHERI